MTPFQQEWMRLSARWQLSIETDVVVRVAAGEITVPVLLRDFGAPRGMLLVTDYDLIAPHHDDLVGQGFGYSCLSEPAAEDERTDADAAFMDMLADWGWMGNGDPPEWYRTYTS